MPDLLNLLEHKKNTQILVDGKIYKIGPDGVARDVTEEDAVKLLQNQRVWKPYDPEKAAELKAKAKAAARGKMQLIGPGGPIPKDDKPGDPMDPNVEVYKRPPATQKEPEPPVPEKAEPKPEPEPEEEEVSGEPAAEAEAAGDEWPDPDESMAIGYLREMADAYEVSFNQRTSKKTLVKRIHAAMYD